MLLVMGYICLNLRSHHPAVNRGCLATELRYSDTLCRDQGRILFYMFFHSFFFQVTIQTESERQLDKLRRKEEKRNKRGADYGSAYDMATESFSSLLLASEKRQPFDDLIGTGEGLRSCALPQGSTRLCEKGYEEVSIPPTPTAPMTPDEKLVLALSFCTFCSYE